MSIASCLLIISFNGFIVYDLDKLEDGAIRGDLYFSVGEIGNDFC